MFRYVSPKVVVVVAALVAVVCAHSVWSADNAGSLQGAVKNSSGAPVSGAFVKVSSAERRVHLMVVSQDQGRYTVSNLPPGKYTAQGIGNGLQSEPSAPVDVAAGRAATVDVVLSAPQAMRKPKGKPRVDAAETGNAPPLPEGEGKNIIEGRCITCHNSQRVSSQHHDRARWQATLEQMRLYMRGLSGPGDLTDPQAEVLLDYVTKNFGPVAGGNGGEGAGRAKEKADPNSHLSRTPLQGAAAKYVAVEYLLETPQAEPHDITVDSKGIAWISERTTGHIARFDPDTFAYTRIPLPPGAVDSSKSRLNAIQADSRDRLWVSDGAPNRRLVVYDSKAGEFNIFDAPKASMGTSTGNTIRISKDGMVWMTAISNNQIWRLDPATKKFTTYDVPSGVKAKVSARPYGMAASGDGKLWFAQNSYDLIGRVDPATGKVEEFEVPAKGSDPRRMGTDAEGNPWLGLFGVCKLVKIDYRTAKMTLYSPPTPDCGAYSVSVDLKRNLIWVSEQWTGKLARFDPRTETFVEFDLPTPEADVRRIEVDQNRPNRVWWSGSASNNIGYVEVMD